MGDDTEVNEKLDEENGDVEERASPKLNLAIRCTLPNCSCECYAPGKTQIRACETCKHGWVIHALDKLGYNSVYPLGMQVEIVQPNIVFDIASLMLYGTQATPIRLKILLDRLFSVLQHDEVLQVLHGFGWTYEDYARGYILQDRNGRVLDKWSIASRDEEQIIIQQFLRFGETKSIAQEIILQDTKERQDYLYRHSPKSDSDIKKFLERSSLQTHNFARSFDSRHGMLPVSRPAHTPTSSGSRIMSPTRISSFSPGSSREREASRPMGAPKQSTSPMSTSPLNRLSTMQPFDYRRDPIGTALAAGEKSHLSISVPSASASLSIPTRPIPSIPSIPGILPEVRPIIHVQTQPQDLSTTGNMHKVKKEEPTNFSTQNCPPSSGAPRISSLSLSGLSHIPHTMSSHYADKKVKHLRKSANPMKRQWQPSASFGTSTLISPSGKKRVLCTACNKTFCDKGALKIHYSAVHLKEMHSCTVAGCTMLFSSRRSRNRHSANPNPKLHRPTKQKVPDGATVIDDGRINTSRILTPRGTIAQRLFAHPNPSSDHPPVTMPSPLMGAPPVGESLPTSSASNDSLSHISNDSNDQAYYIDHNNRITLLPPEKRPKLDKDYDDDDDIDLEDDGQISIDSDKTEEMLAIRNEQDIAMSSSGSSRKRKSAMPTRCKQTDDDLLYAVSDENNDDTLRAHISRPHTPQLPFPPPHFHDEHSDCEDMPLNLTDPQPKNDAANDADDEAQEEELQCEDKNTKINDFDFNKNCVSENEASLINNNGFKEIEDTAIRKMDHLAQIGLQASKPESVDSGVVPDRAGSGVAFFGQMPMPLAQPIFPDIDPINSRPHSRNTDNGRSSDMESNASFGSSSASRDHSPTHSPSSLERDRFDIPIDRNNPRQCIACGKLFQNQFGVKTHYQNVHLKLMHTCSVEGCNATFPSKRSRDRHSSNLNLHRKLLSTCGIDGENDGLSNSTQSLRDEFLSKIYEGNHYGGCIRENGKTHDKKSSENEDNDSFRSISPQPSNVESPDKRTSVEESLTLRSFLSIPPMNVRDVEPNCNGTKDEQEPNTNGMTLQEASPQPDPEGAVDCHICKERFRDNLVLKEHFEKSHPKEMFRCTIPGCEKVFSTRKSRNRHSQNDNLHRHLMGGTNGDSL